MTPLHQGPEYTMISLVSRLETDAGTNNKSL